MRMSREKACRLLQKTYDAILTTDDPVRQSRLFEELKREIPAYFEELAKEEP